MKNGTNIDNQTINQFQAYQQRSWSYFSSAAGVNLDDIGTKPSQPIIPISGVSGLPTNEFTPPSLLNVTGILGTIPTRYFLNVSGFSGTGLVANGLTAQPFYDYNSGSEDDLDNLLYNSLQKVIYKIAALNKSSLLTPASSRNQTEINQLFLNASFILQDMPYGSN